MIVAQGGLQADIASRFRKAPLQALPHTSANPFLPFSSISFPFFRLPTLVLSCASFSHSRPLFSIASALFDKKRGWPAPVTVRLCAKFTALNAAPAFTFRINTCESVSKQTTSTPFRINTCEKAGGGRDYR